MWSKIRHSYSNALRSKFNCHGVAICLARDTGGYPRIACVITADLYQLAQIPLGQPIHFVACSLEEALKARSDRQRYLEQLAWRLDEDD